MGVSKKISEGDTSFLDSMVTLKLENGTEVRIPFLKYAFYSTGLDDERIDKSMFFIHNFLVQIAKDFTDRDDYSAYKHGLRLFPTISELSFNSPTYDVGMTMNYDHSYTMIDKDDEYTHIVKNFDPQRDLRMTFTCGDLISNLIRSRRCLHFNEGTVSMFFFVNEDYYEYTTPKINTPGMKLSVRPIYKEKEPTQ